MTNETASDRLASHFVDEGLTQLIEPLLRYHETGGHEGDGSDERLSSIRAALTRPLGEGEEAYAAFKAGFRSGQERGQRPPYGIGDSAACDEAWERYSGRSTPPQGEETRAALVRKISLAVMRWGSPHFKHLVSYNTLKEAIEQALSTPSSLPIAPDLVPVPREVLKPFKGWLAKLDAGSAEVSNGRLMPDDYFAVYQVLRMGELRALVAPLSAAPQPPSPGQGGRPFVRMVTGAPVTFDEEDAPPSSGEAEAVAREDGR